MKKEEYSESLKKFQYRKSTPVDPRDGHVHEAYFDENGDGATTEAGSPAHIHRVFGFKLMPFETFDFEKEQWYFSVHPGSLAFAELFTIEEMEIFRVGVHNGDEYTESDLEEIAKNFNALKAEVRPKLKMTHRDTQKTLAGLASYGDIVEVYTKKDESGVKRLYAKIANVPKEVYEWVRDRRFPERSIEIYPSFKLGTKEDSPVYHNVLKAIALLGHEMPAVTGMEPIKLSEVFECQKTVCIGEICFFCDEEAAVFLSAKAAGLNAEMKVFSETKLNGERGTR